MKRPWFNLTQLSLLAVSLFACNLVCLANATVQSNEDVLKDSLLEPATVTEIGALLPDEVSAVSVQRTTTRVSTPDSSETVISEKPPKEDFAKRLELIKEQIDAGIAKGWLNSDEAAKFNERYTGLLAQVDSVRGKNPIPTEQNNSIEQQLNSLNIDLSQKLSN